MMVSLFKQSLLLNTTITNSSDTPTANYEDVKMLKELAALLTLGFLFLSLPFVTTVITLWRRVWMCCLTSRNTKKESFCRIFSKHCFLCKFSILLFVFGFICSIVIIYIQ